MTVRSTSSHESDVVLRAVTDVVRVRPRRARCSGCGGSHVLLLVFVLLRRVDLADVIGAALVAKAAGSGVRSIAVLPGRPVETVRGWLRRFGRRAEQVRVCFTVLLVDTGPDPIPPAALASRFADAVAAAVGAGLEGRSLTLGGRRRGVAVAAGLGGEPGTVAVAETALIADQHQLPLIFGALTLTASAGSCP